MYQIKDIVLKKGKNKHEYLQMSLTTAIVEVGYWKALSNKKFIEL